LHVARSKIKPQGKEGQRQSRSTRDRQLCLLPRLPEDEVDWKALLDPTERFVRNQTLPAKHTLDTGPAHVLRSSSLDRTGALLTAKAGSRMDLNDLPHEGVESWEVKWQRELKFLEIKARREEEAQVKRGSRWERSASVASSSSSTRAPSHCGFSMPESRASSRPSTSASFTASTFIMPGQEGHRVGPPARASSSCGRSACFRGTWAAYDAAFPKLEADLARKARPLKVADVPWPPGSSVCGLLPEDGPLERKKKLNKALLRWHPDKWHVALEASPERGQLARKLAEVTQQILRERTLG